MIIIKESTKDTYVTNRSVGNTSFEKSNVGRASTLDLFKLCNENSNANSSAKIKIDINNDNSMPEVDSGFLLKDTDGNVCSFVFKNEAVQNNGESVELTQSSGSLLIGQKYEIVSLNNGEGGANTDFTLVGSENNNIGTKFIATGFGTGTGTAKSDFIKLTNSGNRAEISAQIKNSINSIEIVMVLSAIVSRKRPTRSLPGAGRKERGVFPCAKIHIVCTSLCSGTMAWRGEG